MHEAQLPWFFIVRGQSAQLNWTPQEGESLEVPECLDWEVEYILLHERNRATRHEIEEHWSLEDLAKARLALDLVDELALRAQRKAEQDAAAKAELGRLNRTRK